ncbi:MAG: hypothetical protein FWD49_07905 [Firmicutes bacterium]|nr:hypothetical protein [Bacillota bacterium]
MCTLSSKKHRFLFARQKELYLAFRVHTFLAEAKDKTSFFVRFGEGRIHPNFMLVKDKDADYFAPRI